MNVRSRRRDSVDRIIQKILTFVVSRRVAVCFRRILRSSWSLLLEFVSDPLRIRFKLDISNTSLRYRRELNVLFTSLTRITQDLVSVVRTHYFDTLDSILEPETPIGLTEVLSGGGEQ